MLFVVTKSRISSLVLLVLALCVCTCLQTVPFHATSTIGIAREQQECGTGNPTFAERQTYRNKFLQKVSLQTRNGLQSGLHSQAAVLPYNIPACGLTYCDDPAVNAAYLSALQNGFLPPVTIRHTVIDPTTYSYSSGLSGLTKANLEFINNKLNEEFKYSNIFFQTERFLLPNNETIYNAHLTSSYEREAFKKMIPELNIYPSLRSYVASMEKGLLGVSTFPWEDIALTAEGGILFNAETESLLKYNGTVAVHEIGHALGLYHVFHGVTESDCSDPCYEVLIPVDATGNMTTGDLCADTRPTPLNYWCYDPISFDQCSGKRWIDTPLQNHMGYSSCPNEFTPQQYARMRCYVDMYLSSWFVENAGVPSTIVFAPTVRVSTNGITISWLPPMGEGVTGFIIRRSDGCERRVSTSYSLEYEDVDVERYVTYTYQVKAFSYHGDAAIYSPPSVAIVSNFATGTGYCPMTTGAIVGISFGVIIFVGLVVAAVIVVVIMKKRKARQSSVDQASVYTAFK